MMNEKDNAPTLTAETNGNDNNYIIDCDHEDDNLNGQRASHSYLSMGMDHDDVNNLLTWRENVVKQWKYTYISKVGYANFVELCICAILWVVCFFVIPILFPLSNKRTIPFQYLLNSDEYVRDFSKNETFHGETVPNLWLWIISLFIPITIQLCMVIWLNIHSQHHWEIDLHNTLCVYLVAIALTHGTTTLIKNYVGYLRPIFFSLCQPDDTYSQCTSGSDEGMYKSFPSGHASTSFCGLTILTCYIHNRWGMGAYRLELDQPVLISRASNANQSSLLEAGAVTVASESSELRSSSNQLPSIYKFRLISILALLPCGMAMFIAASRVHDNKHFPADVVGGSVLGSSIAIFIHHLWFL
jgi:membrane-associated phospholipid phosphatase